MSTRRRSTLLFAAILAAGLALVVWDIDRPFNETDEFWYSQIVREMSSGGDWLVPRFAGVADFNKPPLFYWLSAPGAYLAGPRVGMRILPALCFALELSLLFFFTRKRFGARAALWSAAVFALTYDHLYIHVFKAGTMDGVVNLLCAAAFVVTLRVREGRRYWAALGALWGLIFLAKTAFVAIPAAFLLAHLFFARREGERISWPGLGVLVGAFAVVALPWFVALVVREGTAPLRQMFLDQVLRRAMNDRVAALTGRYFGRTDRGFQLKHLVSWSQPWALLWIPSGWVLWRRRKEITGERWRVLRLAGVWALVTLGIFLAARAGWPWYTSSLHFPAALLVGFTISRGLRGRRDIRAVVTAAVGCAFFVFPLLVHFHPFAHSSGPAANEPMVLSLVPASVVVAVLFYRVRVGLPAAVTWIALVGALMCALMVAKGPASLQGIFTGAGGLLGVLALFGARNEARRLGRVATAALLGLALLYVSVPLSKPRGERREIAEVRRAIKRGALERGRTYRLRQALYGYVVVYAEFTPEYDVRFDPRRRIVSIRRRQP